VSLVVALGVCSRNTPPLPGVSRCLFDELEPCVGAFASFWVCACEIGYKLVPLSLPGFQHQFGRFIAQLVPSLSCALNFDLGCSSLAIRGSTPRGHRDGHGEMRRWSTVSGRTVCLRCQALCAFGVRNTQSAFVETPCFDTEFTVD